MRLPYEYWLKYLLVSAQATTEQIGELCELHQLPVPEDEYLTRLRAELGGRRHITDIPTLRRLKIKGLAVSDPDAVAARELLSEYRLRPALELLIISGMTDADIAHYLEVILKRIVPEAVIGMYRHYFWNVNLLSNYDWEIYFLDSKDSQHGKKLKQGLLRGEEFALWKLGYIKETEQRGIISNMLYESAMRFRELSSYGNGQETALAAKMWAETVFKSAEFLSRDEDAIKSTVEDLNAFALKLGRREISSVASLNNKLTKE
jgi:hypothetical protein